MTLAASGSSGPIETMTPFLMNRLVCSRIWSPSSHVMRCRIFRINKVFAIFLSLPFFTPMTKNKISRILFMMWHGLRWVSADARPFTRRIKFILRRRPRNSGLSHKTGFSLALPPMYTFPPLPSIFYLTALMDLGTIS